MRCGSCCFLSRVKADSDGVESMSGLPGAFPRGARLLALRRGPGAADDACGQGLATAPAGAAIDWG